MKTYKSIVLALLIGASFATQADSAFPEVNGVAYAPDGMLMPNGGPKWWYRSQPSITVTPHQTRDPTVAEQKVIARAQHMMEEYPIKAIALIDGDKVVYQDFNAPAGPMNLFYGMSMGKTVTSMMVGQAICDGKLLLTTRAEELLPELKGSQLGTTTVRDLLRMASGTKNNGNYGALMTDAQLKVWRTGGINLVDVLADPSNANAEKTLFSSYKPGEHFNYASSNPITLGVMVARATGVSYAQWLQAKVLDPMGEEDKGMVAQDPQENGSAAAALSLTMGDWIRFTMWVHKASKSSGCFGDYVREATKTQINNAPRSRRTSGGSFGGYGYLTWTDNEMSPNSFWAIGFGGQRIGWFKNSNKSIVIFSNKEGWEPAMYGLANDWSSTSN